MGGYCCSERFPVPNLQIFLGHDMQLQVHPLTPKDPMDYRFRTAFPDGQTPSDRYTLPSESVPPSARDELWEEPVPV